ncbi:PilN domain-containing protein [Neptunicella sp.]|uniref:PilN domain-containing protein n=1 Tax=Neptunicella sp. TaxID=2125986 RepID=UPI003F6930CD
MKSRVNLFVDELRPKVALFTLNFVSFVWTAALLLMLFIWFWVGQNATSVKDQLAEKNAQNAMLQTRLTDLSQQLSKRKEDPQLLAKISELKQDIHDKQYVVQAINQLDGLESQNFPAIMTDLASIHQPNLWLTQIKVENNKVYLQGRVTDPSVIPIWLRKLGQSTFFAGQDFGQAQIQRQQDEQLHFVIATDLTQQQDEEQKRGKK